MQKITLENISVQTVSQVLAKGGLVVAPSDTVYGLLVDATSEAAVRKLLMFKNRPPGKAISVFLSDIDHVKKTVMMTDKQKSVVQELLPGPFTIILPSQHTVSPLLESERGTLGIRIPDYPFITDLVSVFKKPITATSANISGKSPHYSIESLLRQLPDSKRSLIDLIVDGGKLPRNKPSTILDITGSDIKYLRKGDIVFTHEHSFQSASPSQTRSISHYLYRTFVRRVKEKPIVLLLSGELGAGKTVFVKGIAEKLGVRNIVSPTFTIYYEYETTNSELPKLIHMDLYNIEETTEFSHLGIEQFLKPGVIMCIEWSEKSAALLPLLSDAAVFRVSIEYSSAKERIISVEY